MCVYLGMYFGNIKWIFIDKDFGAQDNEVSCLKYQQRYKNK